MLTRLIKKVVPIIFATVFFAPIANAKVDLNKNVKMESMLPGGHFFYSCQIPSQGKSITIEVNQNQGKYMASSPDNSTVIFSDHPHKAANQFCDTVNLSQNG